MAEEVRHVHRARTARGLRWKRSASNFSLYFRCPLDPSVPRARFALPPHIPQVLHARHAHQDAPELAHPDHRGDEQGRAVEHLALRLHLAQRVRLMRDDIGQGKIILPEKIARNAVINIRAILSHPMLTGMSRDQAGIPIPAYFVHEVEVTYRSERVAHFE